MLGRSIYKIFIVVIIWIKEPQECARICFIPSAAATLAQRLKTHHPGTDYSHIARCSKSMYRPGSFYGLVQFFSLIGCLPASWLVGGTVWLAVNLLIVWSITFFFAPTKFWFCIIQIYYILFYIKGLLIENSLFNVRDLS